MRLMALLTSCTLALSLLAGCGDSGNGTNGGSSTSPSANANGGGAGGGKLQIAVIPKGTTHEYWKSIHAGAVKAMEEGDNNSKYEIIWRGPVEESQSGAQISVVENMLNTGVAGIVLAPNDANALARVVDTAATKKVPVVIIDSDINTDNYKSFVATDNEKGGEMGGEYLAKLLGDKGRVIMMRYAEGSASTEKREQGFLNAMKKHPDIKLVSINQYGGATSDSSQKTAENLVAAYKNADGSLNIDGIFCPNETTTFGMLRALEESKNAGKIKFVGFDASEKLLDGMKSGEIDGLVLQDPVNMGYLGVKTMISVLENKPVEKKIDTGVHLATKENMDEPVIHDLLHPPLDKYLK